MSPTSATTASTGCEQFQGSANGAVDLNAVDIGAAYLPQNQDPTLGTEQRAWRQRIHDRTCCGRSGTGQHQRAADGVLGRISFDPDVAQPALAEWSGVWHELHARPVVEGQHGGLVQQRLQHAADGTISIRADQAEYEKQNENLALQRHVIKSYAVWDLPNARALRAASGGTCSTTGRFQACSPPAPRTSRCAPQTNNQNNGRYDLTYTYQNNGTNANLTGSPDYAAKIVYVGDPGSGCSSNQYAQFNTAAVTGPTYGSVGLESGRFILGGCPDHTVDLAVARNIRLGGNRDLQFRLDVFNVFNTVDLSTIATGTSSTGARRIRRSSIRSTWRMARSIRRGSRRGTRDSAPPPARSRCGTCSCRFGSGSSVGLATCASTRRARATVARAFGPLVGWGPARRVGGANLDGL